jgi:hypothetical protein
MGKLSAVRGAKAQIRGKPPNTTSQMTTMVDPVALRGRTDRRVLPVLLVRQAPQVLLGGQLRRLFKTSDFHEKTSASSDFERRRCRGRTCTSSSATRTCRRRRQVLVRVAPGEYGVSQLHTVVHSAFYPFFFLQGLMPARLARRSGCLLPHTLQLPESAADHPLPGNYAL